MLRPRNVMRFVTRNCPSFSRALASCVTAAVWMMAGSVVAQDDDWDFHAEPSKRLALASVEFGDGLLIAVQCQAAELNVIIGGVPGSDSSIRSVLVTRADGRSRRVVLSAVEGSSLFRSRNARDARFLKGSGQTTITSVPGDARPFRMDIALPSQATGVNNVLTSCGYALDDDRDFLTDVSDRLVSTPALEMAPFARTYTIVRVELSCLVSEGRLTACRSDHERPSAPEVGLATARLANGYRLSLKDGANADGGVLEIVVTGNRIYR